MGRLTRFERANAGATIRSVRPLHHNRHEMAGVVGFEPTSTVLETAALPLNYTPTFALLEIYFRILILLNALVNPSTFY